MNDLIFSYIKNKKVLILGFGREGKSSLNRILKVGGFKSVTVADKNDVSKDVPTGVFTLFGDSYQDSLNDYDVVFKSPGIVLNEDISKYSCLITSQTEIFIERFRDQIIAVTGTKGKSTTSSFLYHVLKTAGKDCLFAGNIGIPLFEIADEVKENTIIVAELSCHQLEYTKVSPKKAVLLNIYEDHLDHYGTREKYGLAKKNIYKYQKSEDFLYTLKEVTDEWGESKSKTIYVSTSVLPFKSFDEIDKVKLKGSHNLLNVAFAYEALRDCEIPDETFIKAVSSFEPLPHRLEFVGKISGVDYYDDSISTTVKSTISAVESIHNASILLLGGMERNIDYEELINYVAKSHLKYVICMYESGRRIYEMYENTKKNDDSPKAVLVSDLEEAVDFAKENAKANDAVLLSPAAASYGYFKNFEERGDVFKTLVKN
jgi:UDP-N-acetylmuramoylalanine--D-glutamate ligase